jgi:hypothetical protein
VTREQQLDERWWHPPVRRPSAPDRPEPDMQDVWVDDDDADREADRYERWLDGAA